MRSKAGKGLQTMLITEKPAAAAAAAAAAHPLAVRVHPEWKLLVKAGGAGSRAATAAKCQGECFVLPRPAPWPEEARGGRKFI